MLEETKNVVYDTKYVSDVAVKAAPPADMPSETPKKSGEHISFFDKLFASIFPSL
jgi:hypothetical protein